MKLYNELKNCTSVQMRKKMIASDIMVAVVIDAYKDHGFDGLSRLFGAKKTGKFAWQIIGRLKIKSVIIWKQNTNLL